LHEDLVLTALHSAWIGFEVSNYSVIQISPNSHPFQKSLTTLPLALFGELPLLCGNNSITHQARNKPDLG
jgi:hypothetical protein